MMKNKDNGKNFNNTKNKSSSNNRYNRGSKPQNKCGKVSSNEEKFADNEDSRNDPTWYVTNPELMSTVASFPFSWVAGRPFQMASDKTFFTGTYSAQFCAPGVMGIGIIPTLPRTVAAQDGLNMATIKQFSFLRHTLSANLPYDMPELACMQIAMANIYSYINYLRRAYGIINVYANENRYMPDTLIAAMGINPSVKNNLANFLFAINVLTEKASSLAVPASINYFKRQAMLYANVYTDGTSLKDQMYLTVPYAFFRYDEVSGAGSSLVLDPFISVENQDTDLEGEGGYGNLKNVDQLLNYGNILLDAVLGSQDIALISSNILRAYGSDGVLKLTALTADFRTVPVFDIGMLEQISNAEPMDDFIYQTLLSKERLNVTQVVDDDQLQMLLSYTPYLTNTEITSIDQGDSRQKDVDFPETDAGAGASMKHLVNTTTAYTDSSLVLESTRLKYNIDRITSPAIQYNYSFATECVVDVRMWGMEPSSDAALPGYNIFMYRWKRFMVGSTATGNPADVYTITHHIQGKRLYFAQSFRFRPQAWLMQTNATGTTGSRPVPLFNIDNYTLIEQDELENLNNVVIMSLFDSPSVVKAYNR